MSKLLINDCNYPAIDGLLCILEKTVTLVQKPFCKETDVTEFDMVLLNMDSDTQVTLEKLQHLRYASRFRNIPILLIQSQVKQAESRSPFLMGTKNILSLEGSPAALAQILQGYLMPGRQPKPVELQYLNAFIESTQKVFSTMASMQIFSKGIYFKHDHNILGDVSGAIGLSGNAEGMVVITFYWELAQEIISRIMGVDKNEISPELINDGVGELINMISGAAKKYLVETPYYFQLSIPTVFVGWQHGIGYPEKRSVAVLVFDFETKSFAVQISLTAKENNHRR